MCAVTPTLVCVVGGLSCQAPTRPSAGGDASLAESAGRDDGSDHWTTAAARLRAAAMSTPAEAVIVTRPDLVMDRIDVDFVDGPTDSSLGFEAAIALVDEVARRRIDLAIATTNPAPESGRPSREATRLYLLGRTAIADSRPGEAIVPLERSARSGGGVAALRALAEACDRAGRPA